MINFYSNLTHKSLPQFFKIAIKNLTYILIMILSFLIVFKPPLPFTTFNPLHISGIISIIFLIFNIKYILSNTNFYKVIFFSLILVLYQTYFIIVFFVNSESLLNNVSFIFWIFDIVPSALFIAIMCKKYSFKIVNIFIHISLFQAIISLIAFFNLSFKDYLINSYINYGYLEVADLSSHRIFGLAANATFSMPIYQSSIALLLLYRTLKKHIFYVFPLSLVIFSAFINSRTSLVIFIIASSLLLLYYFLNLKLIHTILISFFIYFFSQIFIYYFLPLLIEINPSTFQWILDGLDEFNSLINGNISSSDYYFFYLFNFSRYSLPNTLLNFLFGRGIHTYSGNTLGIKSDLGFINDLWLGGMFYVLSFYSFIGLLIFKISNNFLKYRSLILSISFSILFLSNIKGVIFSENDIMNSIIILYIYYLI